MTVLPAPHGTHVLRARLWKASRPETDRPVLLVIHPPAEDAKHRGRCYVEFRVADGWDRSLEIGGDDLDQQAVVVHQVADSYSLAQSKPDIGVRCWYRGQVRVPIEVDADVDIPDGPLSVRVTNIAPDFAFVDLEIAAGSTHSTLVTAHPTDTIVEVRDEKRHATRCGNLRSGTLVYRTNTTYDAVTFGYGGTGGPIVDLPELTWQVGTLAVPAGKGTFGPTTDDGRVVDVDFELDSNTAQQLVLTSNPADGAYRIPVTCIAADANGNTSTAHAEFTPRGVRTGFDEDSERMANDCMSRLVERIRLRPQDLLIPGRASRLDKRERQINRARLETVITKLSAIDRAAAAQLREIADLQFGR